MTEQSEREALEALFADLHGTKDSIPLHRYTIKWRDRRDRFTTMLDCGAYLNAAMMLRPEGSEFGLSWSRMSVDMGGKNWRCHVGTHRASGRTPALALCAAIEAAIARAGE